MALLPENNQEVCFRKIKKREFLQLKCIASKEVECHSKLQSIKVPDLDSSFFFLDILEPSLG